MTDGQAYFRNRGDGQVGHGNNDFADPVVEDGRQE